MINTFMPEVKPSGRPSLPTDSGWPLVTAADMLLPPLTGVREAGISTCNFSPSGYYSRAPPRGTRRSGGDEAAAPDCHTAARGPSAGCEREGESGRMKWNMIHVHHVHARPLQGENHRPGVTQVQSGHPAVLPNVPGPRPARRRRQGPPVRWHLLPAADGPRER